MSLSFTQLQPLPVHWCLPIDILNKNVHLSTLNKSFSSCVSSSSLLLFSQVLPTWVYKDHQQCFLHFLPTLDPDALQSHFYPHHFVKTALAEIIIVLIKSNGLPHSYLLSWHHLDCTEIFSVFGLVITTTSYFPPTFLATPSQAPSVWPILLILVLLSILSIAILCCYSVNVLRMTYSCSLLLLLSICLSFPGCVHVIISLHASFSTDCSFPFGWVSSFGI